MSENHGMGSTCQQFFKDSLCPESPRVIATPQKCRCLEGTLLFLFHLFCLAASNFLSALDRSFKRCQSLWRVSMLTAGPYFRLSTQFSYVQIWTESSYDRFSVLKLGAKGLQKKNGKKQKPHKTNKIKAHQHNTNNPPPNQTHQRRSHNLCFLPLFQREPILHTAQQGSAPWSEAGTQNTKKDYVGHRIQHKPVVSPQKSFRSI